MKPTIKHQAKVVNGKILYYNQELYRNNLYQLEGKQVDVVIKEKHRKASADQFGYYFGGILPTCHEANLFQHFDKSDDIDIYFEDKFRSYRRMIVLPNERYEVKKHRGLSEMSVSEVSEFLERVLAHCEELGIHVLTPDEYHITHYSSIIKKKQDDTTTNP